MNRREAILTGVTGIAAAIAAPSSAIAQSSDAGNPELEPIRALLEAYDKAFTNHDLEGVMACIAAKATILGTGPGEIWSGPEEIKGAHEHFFETFDKGEQSFDYEFDIGGVSSETGWIATSGNVTGKKDGNEFAFPLNVLLTVAKESGNWAIVAMHFSILAPENE